MSISSSLNNALSGLTAASRAAEVVSSNLANSMTDGYGRRRIDLSSAVLGGNGSGVRIDGITRIVDSGLLTDRRFAESELSYSQTTTTFFNRFEGLLGLPGEAGSLSDHINQLENALIESSNSPSSQLRLDGVANALGNVANELNRLTDNVQSMRLEADRSISTQVETLNATLEQIDVLNDDILRARNSGLDVSGLIDQRQVAIDQVSQIIPVQEVPRDYGQVALMTPGGGILLDGTIAEFSFIPNNLITAELNVADGHLSQLSMNGEPIDIGSETSRLSGGSLAAAFVVRDELGVNVQADLDGIARDLAERFQGPSVDPTQTAASIGLFTDSGLQFDPLTETGFAGRIAINVIIDLSVGADTSLLRDGLGALTQGPSGDATQLTAWLDALTAARTQPDGSFQSATERTTSLYSSVGQSRSFAQADQSFAAARYDGLREAELQNGVETDAEMQNLLLVEQAFSANAKVIQTIDDMMQTLLRLGA
jgi:flagellar hook-associated protein 1 FlgK